MRNDENINIINNVAYVKMPSDRPADPVPILGLIDLNPPVLPVLLGNYPLPQDIPVENIHSDGDILGDETSDDATSDLFHVADNIVYIKTSSGLQIINVNPFHSFPTLIANTNTLSDTPSAINSQYITLTTEDLEDLPLLTPLSLYSTSTNQSALFNNLIHPMATPNVALDENHNKNVENLETDHELKKQDLSSSETTMNF